MPVPDAISRLRLGVSANLDDGGSIHRATFERAVRMAAADAGRSADDFIWESDRANPEGGARASRRLVEAGVGAVVGHYASGAAWAALPAYREAGIAMLLPAATADELVTPDGVAFRFCPPDRELAAAIADDLRGAHAAASLALRSDGSVHGDAVTKLLAAEAARRGIAVLDDTAGVAGAAGAEALFFAGLFGPSAAFVRERRAAGDRRPILLADDALHAALPGEVGSDAGNVTVYGFATPEGTAEAIPEAADLLARYRDIHGEPAGIYFLETYAAMRVAIEAIEGAPSRRAVLDRLAGSTWRTVLGPLDLARREAAPIRYLAWAVEQGRLLPVRECRHMVGTGSGDRE